MMKREELSRIASVKFQKALSDRARAVTPRVLAFCVMAVSLVFTLAVIAANLRLTYLWNCFCSSFVSKGAEVG